MSRYNTDNPMKALIKHTNQTQVVVFIGVLSLVAIAAVIVAAGIVRSPLFTLFLVAGIIVFSLGISFAPYIQRFWLMILGCLLIGYTFLDKGFAYLGFPPLYVGEMVFGLGMFAVVIGGGVRMAFRTPLSWLYLAFALDGLLRTLPYISMYRLDALRDGVIWAYGVFALLVSSFLLQNGWTARVPRKYARWLPLFLIWMPIGFLMQRLAGDSLPLVPGSSVSLVTLKPGDMAVHLAGVASFLLLNLHKDRGPSSSVLGLSLKESIWWVLFLIGGLMVSSVSRGGFLSMIVALSLVLLLGPRRNWAKLALLGIVIAIVVFVFNVFSLNVEIDIGRQRSISVEQVIVNMQSIIGNTDEGNLSGTRKWRLDWWNKIINYTVYGEYFWTGKGFGINLAEDDAIPREPGLRSPHNGHLTILARAGVPGFVLWVLLQGGFCLSLLYYYIRALIYEQYWWARVNLWILAYWVAFMINASFDVFLEGPQQGIWFWSLFGFGIAAMISTKRQIKYRYQPAMLRF